MCCGCAIIAGVPIRTKRWNDRREEQDGFRLLICRIRPRGVSRANETWDEWWPDLGPSRELLAAFQGRTGAVPLQWLAYSARYIEEMTRQTFRIRSLTDRNAASETVTLLCSAACTDEARCHRTLLARVIERVTSESGRRRRP